MSTDAARRERAEQMLAEVADLSLMLARDLAIHAREAEDAGEKVALNDAFDRTTRAMRLTLALEIKLARDAARDAREAAADTALRESRIMRAAQAAHLEMTEPTPAEIQKRRVCAAMNRLLWTESEGDREAYIVLRDDLNARLYEAEESPDFDDLPLEAVVQALKADMGLTGKLVITTPERLAPANTRQPPLADTG